jgi:hypothetical protein
MRKIINYCFLIEHCSDPGVPVQPGRPGSSVPQPVPERLVAATQVQYSNNSSDMVQGAGTLRIWEFLSFLGALRLFEVGKPLPGPEYSYFLDPD